MIGLWVTEVWASIHGIPGRARPVMIMAGRVGGLLFYKTIGLLARNDMVLEGEENYLRQRDWWACSSGDLQEPGLWVTEIWASIHGIPGRARPVMMMAGRVGGLLFYKTIGLLARNDKVWGGEKITNGKQTDCCGFENTANDKSSIHGIPGRARLMMMAGLVFGSLFL